MVSALRRRLEFCGPRGLLVQSSGRTPPRVPFGSHADRQSGASGAWGFGVWSQKGVGLGVRGLLGLLVSALKFLGGAFFEGVTRGPDSESSTAVVVRLG